MAKCVLDVTEIYRVDTEDEVATLIEDFKNQANEEGYIPKGYTSSLKEKKAKGEVVDTGYQVKLTKVFGTFWEC